MSVRDDKPRRPHVQAETPELAARGHLAGGPMSSQEHLDELSEDEFANAVFVRADEPDDDIQDGIPITRAELQMCAPEPLRLVVLLHWRAREQDGRPRSAEAVWSALTELGMCGDDGETVRLDEVGKAVAFLLDRGVVTAASGGEL